MGEPYSVTPADKQILLKTLYDAAKDKINPRSKLSYLEIREMTGFESSRVIDTATFLEGERYLSKFSPKDVGILSFGLSEALMASLDANPKPAEKVIEEISYKSNIHRI